MENVKVVSQAMIAVIQVVATAGSGGRDDPERTVYLYYSDQGHLLAAYDPINDPDYQSPYQPLPEPRP